MLESASHMGSSTYVDNRKMGQQQMSGMPESHHGTDEKEGGSNEDPYASKCSLNNYNGLKEQRDYTPTNQEPYQHISESSPELSGTNQLSADSRNYASSSLADSPSPTRAGAGAYADNEEQLLQNLNTNASKINAKLSQMQKKSQETSESKGTSKRDVGESESLSPLHESEL